VKGILQDELLIYWRKNMDSFIFASISMVFIGIIISIFGSLYQSDMVFATGAGILVTGIVGLLIVGLNRE